MRLLFIMAVLVPWLSAEADAWEARRRGSGRYESKSNWKNVAPTLGLHGGSVFLEGNELVHSEDRVNVVGAWLGLAFNPGTTLTAPFLAVGTELNLVGNSAEGGFFEGVPELRTGLVVFNEKSVFPIAFELYGLGGYRIGNGLRPGAVRIGAGLSLPAFAVAQYEAYKIPFIPWMVELFYDVSRERELGFRAGYHF